MAGILLRHELIGTRIKSEAHQFINLRLDFSYYSYANVKDSDPQESH